VASPAAPLRLRHAFATASSAAPTAATESSPGIALATLPLYPGLGFALALRLRMAVTLHRRIASDFRGLGLAFCYRTSLRSWFLLGTVGGYIVQIFAVFQLHKVRDVKEGIAFQPDVHECGLHSWKHAGDAAFVDGSCQGVFVFEFEVNLGELIVLH
jgi:hypothetical protein